MLVASAADQKSQLILQLLGMAPIIKSKCFGAAGWGLAGGEGTVPYAGIHTEKSFPLLFRCLILI